MLLWASVHISNIEFSHETPDHHIIRIFASYIWGKDNITAKHMVGTYQDWYVKAASGNLDLNTYNIEADHVTICHHNLTFFCQKGSYIHKNKKIYCKKFQLNSQHHITNDT